MSVDGGRQANAGLSATDFPRGHHVPVPTQACSAPPPPPSPAASAAPLLPLPPQPPTPQEKRKISLEIHVKIDVFLDKQRG